MQRPGKTSAPLDRRAIGQVGRRLVARRGPVALLPEPARAVPLPVGRNPDPARGRVSATDPDPGAAPPAPVPGAPPMHADDRSVVVGRDAAEARPQVMVVAPIPAEVTTPEVGGGAHMKRAATVEPASMEPAPMKSPSMESPSV